MFWIKNMMKLVFTAEGIGVDDLYKVSSWLGGVASLEE